PSAQLLPWAASPSSPVGFYWHSSYVHRTSAARNARPRATEVNSPPERTRAAPNRASKIRRTAGTKEEPPVRNTLSTSGGLTAVVCSRESTQRSIEPSSSEIHDSK